MSTESILNNEVVGEITLLEEEISKHQEELKENSENLAKGLSEIEDILEDLDDYDEEECQENLFTQYHNMLIGKDHDEFDIEQSEPCESLEEFSRAIKSINLILVPYCFDESSDEYFRKRYSEEGRPKEPIKPDFKGSVFGSFAYLYKLSTITVKLTTSLDILTKQLLSLGMKKEEIIEIKIDDRKQDDILHELDEQINTLSGENSSVSLDELKNDPEIKKEVKELDEKLSSLRETNQNLLDVTIEIYKKTLSEFLEEKRKYEEVKRILDEKEKMKCEELYQKSLETHKKYLERWEEERRMWIPNCLTKQDILNLYEEYKLDPQIVLSKINHYYGYDWLPFGQSISLGLDFAQSITKTEKEARCVYEAIRKGPENEGRSELLTKYKFNITEYERIIKVFINPPFPLRNMCHDYEYENDPLILADMIRNESYHKLIKVVSELENIPDVDQRVQILFSVKDDSNNTSLFARVHSGFIKNYPKLEAHVTSSKQIEVTCQEVKNAFVSSLYKMDVDRDLPIEVLEELMNLFKNFEMENLQMLSKIYLKWQLYVKNGQSGMIQEDFQKER